MKNNAEVEPQGAGLIQSALPTQEEERELSAFIAQSKKRNADLIKSLKLIHPQVNVLVDRH